MGKRGFLKNIVFKIIWAEDKQEYNIEVIDRLSQSGYRMINGREILGVTYFDQMILEDESTIPLHRIVRVYYKGTILIDREKQRDDLNTTF